MADLNNGGSHSKRVVSAGIGLVVANFAVALLVDQFGLRIHPNVITTGSLLLASIINILYSKYFK